jgi:multidrug efflux system outer membrane protein
MMRILTGLTLALAAGLLSACSLAPDYHVPVTSTPVAFKETGPWTQATPEDALPKGTWWTLYGDKTLDGLEPRIDSANPTLAAALARYDQSRAYVGEAESSYYPLIGADVNPTRNRQTRSARRSTMKSMSGAAFAIRWRPAKPRRRRRPRRWRSFG